MAAKLLVFSAPYGHPEWRGARGVVATTSLTRAAKSCGVRRDMLQERATGAQRAHALAHPYEGWIWHKGEPKCTVYAHILEIIAKIMAED